MFRKRHFYFGRPIFDEFEDEKHQITFKNALGITIGLLFSGFIMYSVIIIESRITDKERKDWIASYAIGFIIN